MYETSINTIRENFHSGRLDWLARPSDGRVREIDHRRDVRKLHSHRYLEVVQLVEGEAALRTVDGFHALRESHACVVPAGTLHAERSDAPDVPYRLCWSFITPSSIVFLHSEYHPDQGHASLRDNFWVALPGELAFDTVTRSFNPDDEAAFKAVTQGWFLLALTKALETLQRGDDGPKIQFHRRIAHEIVRYLDVHFREPVTVAELASIVRYSPNHLNTLFRKTIGESIHRYLLNRRLDNAKTLLANTDKLIKEVAHDSGFEDPLYFSRIFRKHCEISPKAFREQRRHRNA